jgi:MFS family permease
MSDPQLGLRANAAQFTLLVVVNAFVGAMIGMERSILPAIAEQEMHLAAKSAVLSFIVVFGVTKAFTNFLAGRLSERLGRKQVLVAGWLVAIPVPLLLMWAPSWEWILVANAFLGVSQGLTWSTTVIMKIDLVGPKRRGFAMGLNELAGYVAVALSALATGYIAAHYGLRPEPFYLGIVFVVIGLVLSVVVVKETKGHAQTEAKMATAVPTNDRNLISISQTGLVNNLNDGMAWGLFPLVFAAASLSIDEIGALSAIYPATWGLTQAIFGAWSDRVGRKKLIVGGMWIQAIGIVLVAQGVFVLGCVALGIGTAMVYPTLLAAIGDVAHPSWRASAVGTYRFWRDLGYAVGAVIAGVVADALGLSMALYVVAFLTFLSGAFTALRMTLR